MKWWQIVIGLAVFFLGIPLLIFAGLVFHEELTTVDKEEAVEKPIGILGTPFVANGVECTPVGYELVGKTDTGALPPEGAQYLILHIRVKNISEIAKSGPSVYDISLYYKGQKISAKELWNVGSYKVGNVELEPYVPTMMTSYVVYPGVVQEGWCAYCVPLPFDIKAAKVLIRFSADGSSNYVAWTFYRQS